MNNKELPERHTHKTEGNYKPVLQIKSIEGCKI